MDDWLGELVTSLLCGLPAALWLGVVWSDDCVVGWLARWLIGLTVGELVGWMVGQTEW